MKSKITALIMILILVIGFTGCEIIYNEADKPTVSVYKMLPVNVDTITTYDRIFIEEFSQDDQLCIMVEENKGESQMRLPTSGKNLRIQITTTGGDEEILSLDSDDPFGMRSPDVSYFYFKIVSPAIVNTPNQNNGILEFTNVVDTMYFEYTSCLWPYYLMSDTLIYKGD